MHGLLKIQIVISGLTTLGVWSNLYVNIKQNQSIKKNS